MSESFPDISKSNPPFDTSVFVDKSGKKNWIKCAAQLAVPVNQHFDEEILIDETSKHNLHWIKKFLTDKLGRN